MKFENRDKFLQKLFDVCESLSWNTDSDNEIYTHVGSIKIRLGYTRDGDFLQIIPKGTHLGPTVEAKENSLVNDIRKRVRTFMDNKKKDEIWKNAIALLDVEIDKIKETYKNNK